MGIKDLLLNKGWAGTTISRNETADRVNPVIRAASELLHYYMDAADKLPESDALQTSLKTLRMDLVKLSETILSAGGVAYNGVDLEPGSLQVGDDPEETLEEKERALADLIAAEGKVEHQMRTRAVLDSVRRNGEERLRLIRSIGRN